MRKTLEKLRTESGSVQVVELTLIFPFVLLVLAFLIFTGSYILQGVFMYDEAQRIAVIAARESSIPGYEKFYGQGCSGITAKADFNWTDGYSPAKGVINAIMKIHDPYRYIGNGFLSSDNKNDLEDAAKRLVAGSTFVAGSDISCTVETSNNIISHTIKVNVVKKVELPGYLKPLGLFSSADLSVTAIAVVGDPGEFIRNTDIAIDLGDYLWNDLKFGNDNQTMSQRVSIFTQKFKDAKTKLGW